MLYELEWRTPHTSPGGKSVKDWVAEIKAWEEKGWLVDPDLTKITCPKERRQREALSGLCMVMCWRERCHRAGRCKTRLKLAIREFQPEYGIVFYKRAGLKATFNCEPNPEKMAIMEDIFDKIEEHCPQLATRAHANTAQGKRK